MSCLHYKNQSLCVERVSLAALAEQYGTPTYVYSKAKITENWHAFADALKPLKHRICYAVKANSNIAILQLLANLGAGFDIVSAGELARVLKAKGDPEKIIFSGVGKQVSEIKAAIAVGVSCINVESEAELIRLNDIAKQLNKKIAIALRVNPDVDPVTHAYISTGKRENKFGINADAILPLCKQLHQFEYLTLMGLATHIGSQLTDLTPFAQAIDCMLHLYELLKKEGITIKSINMGGGLGIFYEYKKPPSVADFGKLLHDKFQHYPVELTIEPGRAMVGEAGALLTRVEYIKTTEHKRFAIVDAGMNDLLRPALYQAWQAILPVHEHALPMATYDVVGPICESADFLGKDRKLAIQQGDLLAVDCAGAYGFSMASNYNSRGRAAEVLVDGDKSHLIRRRETVDELYASERLV